MLTVIWRLVALLPMDERGDILESPLMNCSTELFITFEFERLVILAFEMFPPA
jgi:hypothetical protein